MTVVGNHTGDGGGGGGGRAAGRCAVMLSSVPVPGSELRAVRVRVVTGSACLGGSLAEEFILWHPPNAGPTAKEVSASVP